MTALETAGGFWKRVAEALKTTHDELGACFEEFLGVLQGWPDSEKNVSQAPEASLDEIGESVHEETTGMELVAHFSTPASDALCFSIDSWKW